MVITKKGEGVEGGDFLSIWIYAPRSCDVRHQLFEKQRSTATMAASRCWQKTKRQRSQKVVYYLSQALFYFKNLSSTPCFIKLPREFCRDWSAIFPRQCIPLDASSSTSSQKHTPLKPLPSVMGLWDRASKPPHLFDQPSADLQREFSNNLLI